MLRIKRIAFNILGFATLIFGAAGILLPILPTTPFVLCAAGCFSAANPFMYHRLAKGKYFGEYIRNYREHTGISKAARTRGLVFLWTSLIISAALIRRPGALIILAAVGIIISIHILTIRKSVKTKT